MRIQEPEFDTIPLATAAAMTSGWLCDDHTQEELRAHYAVVLGRKSGFAVPRGQGVVIRFGSAQLALVGGDGRLLLIVGEMEQWVEGTCWDFVDKLQQHTSLQRDLTRCWSDLLDLSRRLSEDLQRSFYYAVRDGGWQIRARVGSPIADFVDIPFDVWRHYIVTDGFKGTAVAPSGDHLFSICVRPPAGWENDEADAEGETVLDRRDRCREWLTELMRANPTSPVPKRELFEQARRKLGDISERAFKQRIWSEAITASGALRWQKGGRRPSLRK